MAAKKDTPDAVEKMLLGLTPDDTLTLSPADPADPMVQRLLGVRRYLENAPAARTVLHKQVELAWRSNKGARQAFLGAVAEPRAQILSRAQLDRPREPGAEAAVDFQRDFTRYLLQFQGSSGDVR